MTRKLSFMIYSDKLLYKQEILTIYNKHFNVYKSNAIDFNLHSQFCIFFE